MSGLRTPHPNGERKRATTIAGRWRSTFCRSLPRTESPRSLSKRSTATAPRRCGSARGERTPDVISSPSKKQRPGTPAPAPQRSVDQQHDPRARHDLELAIEYGYIRQTLLAGRKRLLRESKPLRSYLQPEQVAALLRAAGRMDSEAAEEDSERRQPLLAVLALAGLRIGEALDLRWRDVDPSCRWLQVAQSKTDANPAGTPIQH